MQERDREVFADRGVGLELPVGASELVSLRADGEPPRKRTSLLAAISGDGRYVTFLSNARKILPPPRCAKDEIHVYLHDRETGTTSLVDARPDGQCANGPADTYNETAVVAMSADGRLVTFASSATDLTTGGAAEFQDVFVRDVVAQTTTIVSLAADGGPADNSVFNPDISADGSTVVFESYATNLVALEGSSSHGYGNIYRHDLATGTTSLASKGPAGRFPRNTSGSATVSGDGNLITFVSVGGLDVAPEDGCDCVKVVIHDVAADTTTTVSHPLSGEPIEPEFAYSLDPAISADGSTIAFESYVSNLVPDDTKGASVNKHV